MGPPVEGWAGASVGTIGYFGFLATRVAPRRLLATAARRATKAAWNRVSPPLAPPRDRLLDVLGCAGGGAPALARLLSRPRPGPTPWSPASLRAALARHVPGEIERVVARAEAAAEGRISVYGVGVDVSLGGGTDWQLDPFHGGRFSGWAPSFALPAAPGLDPKMAWAIGRGEQWVALAQGAVLDPRRGDALAEALSASVRDFVVQNPVGRGVHWTCAMEAALRAWNLVLALWILSARAEPDPALAVEAARLLVSTGRFVLAHLEDDTAVPNNHLAADWLGLLACAEGLPEWPEAPRWRTLALGGLRAAIADQVNDDGTSFEGSVPYQRLAAEIFASGLVLAHGARRPLGAAYARRLRALFASTRALLSSSGDLPQIGDSDSGRVLALRARGPTEGGYLLPLGAALLRDPALLARPGTVADAAEVAWLLGPRALDALASAPPGRPPASASFPGGGFHALRRGALEAFVSCGPSGQRGLGGHSHNDKLSLELHVAGALAVCDAGTGSYTGDPELRNALRSTRAHATVAVDGLEQSPIPAERLFALPDAADARLLEFEPGGIAARLAGEHRGFARAGVVHRREISVAERGMVVVDRLLGRGPHGVELRWPFASPLARVRRLSTAEAAALARLARAARLRRPLDPAHGVEVPLGAAGTLVIAFACPPGLVPAIAPSPRSPGYGRVEDGSSAVVAGTVACPAALATLFLHLPAGGAAP